MNIKCSHKDLSHALNAVSRVVSTRTALPILSNILLETDDGRLKVSATNMVTHISAWIDAKAIRREGAITVPAKTFHSLIQTMPRGIVQMLLNKKKQTLKIKSAHSTSNLKGIAPDEFPLPVGGEVKALVAPDALKRAIDQVVFAASKDEIRPILSGVLMHLDNDGLLMAATDGFRLSECSVPLEAAISGPIDVIVPRSTIEQLRRVIGNQKDPVGIAVSEGNRNVVFGLSDIEVVSQTLDGKFPDYKKIVPVTYATQVIVESEQLHRACKAVRVFARDGGDVTHLTVSRDGTIAVEATSAETGDGVVAVDTEVVGEPFEIALNVDFLLEVLGVMPGKTVIEFAGVGMPCVLRGDEDSDTFFHVIMPMHMEESD
jgi:DNA polymerase-3 subunit beta